MLSQLPDGWREKQSSSRPGKVYYINQYTRETTWDFPSKPAMPPAPGDEVQALHILKKHSGSRRPASWRNQSITQSKDEAIAQITAIKSQLEAELASKGSHAMEELFRKIAFEESDCGSHERGGDLGVFGRGQMQKAFEDASFALQVGQLSGLVDSDSGIHIILRIR